MKNLGQSHSAAAPLLPRRATFTQASQISSTSRIIPLPHGVELSLRREVRTIARESEGWK
jgi:hypothetical protein